MSGYSPLKITGMSTGLVQDREEFLLPDDAYPVLQNAYVWRERIIRKSGYQLLGRLQKKIGTTDGSGNAVIVLAPLPIQPGIASFSIGSDVFNDPGGSNPVNLLTNSSGTGTLDRASGTLTITGSIATTDIQYFPGLPVMGIRTREPQNSAIDQTIFFDQNYAYIFDAGLNAFQEYLPATNTTWNAHAASVSATDFFWSTNYWTSSNPPFTTANRKLFWVTNNTGEFGANADSPRITDGTTWIDFFPTVIVPGTNNWSQIDAGPNYLTNWLSMLPYRGRMVTFNTWEGPTKASSINYPNRIRWATIGNPFIAYSAGPPAKGSWRDDIRGQGGFLDIPTSEDIVAVGFVRDNLVIYCERTTWQLRYTGRSIAPFQIEKVNSELGAEGPFSAVQFDTSLVGIGDKGIVECDSYKSERIDIKIPDFVFKFSSINDGVFRVHGVRDFPNRLSYWTIPYASSYDPDVEEASRIFPNQRLVYNYENDSWALFNDSLTTLGTYQAQSSRTWLNTKIPWIECHFPWISQPLGTPIIVGGNQQGFIEQLDELNTNDVSLFISNITQGQTVVVTSPNHNMDNGFVIKITGIKAGTSYSDLNGGIFSISLGDDAFADPANKFRIMQYNPVSDAFDIPVIGSPVGTYAGGGLISIRENFSITSKKFNFLDEGQSIQLGYIDVLMSASGTSNPGAISIKIYLDYDDVNASNTLPKNEINGVNPATPDTFFNSIIPTTPSTLAVAPQGTKFWHRAFCATRANFITIQYLFSNSQLVGLEQENDVQIDAQVLWIRRGGRMTQL